MQEFISDNIIRIAEKEFRTYLGQCDRKFSKYPKVILSFGESFAEKGRTIANILGAIGIKIHESNINNNLGNIKFKRNEDEIINKRTGKREKKIFYQMTLTKMNLDIDNIKEFIFADIKDSLLIKNDEPLKNEIKIGNNGLDFYLGQCNLDFQSYDQLVLSAIEDNLEMVKYIIKLLNPLGITVDDDYIDRKNKKIFFHVIEKERINEGSGRKERKKFYRIGLTKIPDLFMYTQPDEAIYLD